MTSLYVYSNAVDLHFLDATFVPLLRTVSIESTSLLNKHFEFVNIQYLPVAYTDSEVVDVRACHDSGETFYLNGGKVDENLHFKQVCKYIKPAVYF